MCPPHCTVQPTCLHIIHKNIREKTVRNLAKIKVPAPALAPSDLCLLPLPAAALSFSRLPHQYLWRAQAQHPAAPLAQGGEAAQVSTLATQGLSDGHPHPRGQEAGADAALLGS